MLILTYDEYKLKPTPQQAALSGDYLQGIRLHACLRMIFKALKTLMKFVEGIGILGTGTLPEFSKQEIARPGKQKILESHC